MLILACSLAKKKKRNKSLLGTFPLYKTSQHWRVSGEFSTWSALAKAVKQVSAYPTNSSTMETSNSGGIASTTWGAASFFCLFMTTGAGAGLKSATQGRGAFISDSHSCRLLFWSAQKAFKHQSCWTYFDSAPQVLLLCRIWRFVPVPLQERVSRLDILKWIHMDRALWL